MGIWIDTDMGFDDIAAVMVAIASGQSVDGISLVFGNTSLEQVQRNAASAVKIFGWDLPVYSGRALPVFCHLETAETILGSSGIPTVGLSLPDIDVPEYSSAFQGLCNWLESGDEPKRILALGPLTNLAALCLARPDLAHNITELVWMGGGITSGNHTASAEFNAFADPEALSIVLAHQLPLKMVDLDLCRKVTACVSDVVPIREADGKNATLMADLLEGFISIATRRGRFSMALYDPVAAVAFCYPEIVTWQASRIDVEVSGEFTRGRTVVETRDGKGKGFNASFGANIDAAKAKAIILNAIHMEAVR